jgi:hypothetical protein
LLILSERQFIERELCQLLVRCQRGESESELRSDGQRRRLSPPWLPAVVRGGRQTGEKFYAAVPHGASRATLRVPLALSEAGSPVVLHRAEQVADEPQTSRSTLLCPHEES